MFENKLFRKIFEPTMIKQVANIGELRERELCDMNRPPSEITAGIAQSV
jgi:hypothetical protein